MPSMDTAEYVGAKLQGTVVGQRVNLPHGLSEKLVPLYSTLCTTTFWFSFVPRAGLLAPVVFLAERFGAHHRNAFGARSATSSVPARCSSP